MKHELELRVQSWVDGELSDRQAAQMADCAARDPEVRALEEELRDVCGTVAANEPALALPESREFYWSKIERAISRETPAPSPSPASWLARWRRLIIPATGVAALACVLSLALNQLGRPTFDEINSIDQGMEAVTFHDQSAEMTVVWLQDNTSTPAATRIAAPATPSTGNDANSDVELE